MTTVYFQLSKAGIANEMLKGISAKRYNSIEIDLAALSENDRKLLLKHSDIQFDALNIGRKAYRWNNGQDWRDFYELDSTDILAELKQIEVKDLANQQEEEKRNQERIELQKIKEAERQAKVLEHRNNILGNKEAALKVSINYWSNNKITHEEEYDQETADFIYNCKKEHEEEEERKKDAEKLAKEQAKENLRHWALKNGSELLKLRIEENMNWYDLANDEYFNSIMPDGFEFLDEPYDSWEVKNATIEQIKALREVKKSFPDAKLKRYKYDLQTEDGYYEDDEDRYEHKDVIVITLKSISGEERIFEKEIVIKLN